MSGVGNGGLSMRNVAAMLRVAQTYKSKNPAVNEDVFFLQYLPSLPEYAGLMPSRQEAYNFAREVPCDDLDATLDPMGLHAAWAYVGQREATAYFDKSIVQH